MVEAKIVRLTLDDCTKVSSQMARSDLRYSALSESLRQAISVGELQVFSEGAD